MNLPPPPPVKQEKQEKKETRKIREIKPMDWKDAHGRSGNKDWKLPTCVVKSEKLNRGNYQKIDASEYLDDPTVLMKKVTLIAKLIKKSNHCTLYTGAGLSKSSGIADYASKAKGSIAHDTEKIGRYREALPTFSHKVISTMEKKKLVHDYVQQNHDGLPQKAGFPQEKINEIHGAWFDPSNPVVQFGNSLRQDCFEWLKVIEKKTDLCLCLGTSLAGMNADRIATAPMNRQLKKKALGTVIVNLQRTKYDRSSAIRVYSKLDDFFKLLAKELKIDSSALRETCPSPPDDTEVYVIPYDGKGKKSKKKTSILDLRKGKQLRMIDPNSIFYGAVGTMRGRDQQGHWVIDLKPPRKIKRRYVIGKWWVDVAMRRAVDQFPYANASIELVEKDLVFCQNHEEVFCRGQQALHEWGIYLKEKREGIESVTYQLGKTFSPSVVILKEHPFALNRISYNEITIGVVVNLKNGKKITTKVELNF